MLPYSLDLISLNGAYERGTLTPGTVVRDIHAAIPALAGNPVWIHLLPLEAAAQQARALEARRCRCTAFRLR